MLGRVLVASYTDKSSSRGEEGKWYSCKVAISVHVVRS